MLHDWYVQAEVIGADIDVMPDVPRTVSRQLSRDNVDLPNPAIVNTEILDGI